MTFQAWKILFLNAMTFHDFPDVWESCNEKLELNGHIAYLWSHGAGVWMRDTETEINAAL